MSRPIHPAADRFPMLDEEALRSLADDIASNGLVNPITVDTTGQIIDGRNRLAACEIAEVEPTFKIHDGDPIDFILSANVERRHLTTGQRAMSTAMVLIDAGRREGGRWQYGSLNCPDLGNSTSRNRLMEAGYIADHRPDLVDRVINGTIALSVAYLAAKDDQNGVDRSPAVQRQSLPAQIDKRVTALSKTVDSLQRLADDDRFTANRERVAPAMKSHLTHTIEVCQDLLDRLTVHERTT